MTDLFRFRRASAVLDKFHELERQEIYFAPPEDLNDPMEGYKDVVWQGDAVVWHNLFRHFLLNAMLMAHRPLGGPSFGEADIRKVIYATFDDLPPAPATARDVYMEICSQFFAEPGISSFVEKLGARSRPMRREELAHYLRALYPFFLHLFFTHPSLKDVFTMTTPAEAFREQMERMNRSLEALVTLDPAQVASAEALFLAGDGLAVQEQIRLDVNLNGSLPPYAALFSYNFASSYVRALDQLIHYPAYYACFARIATNASMWGTYGDSHRGVALKFKTSANEAGDPVLQLKGVTGWHGRQGGAIEPDFGFRGHSVRNVEYSNTYPEIDFFRSIGHLPQRAINRFWFRDETGRESPIRAAIAEDEAKWREGYWAGFEAGLVRKTLDWAHEQEARIAIHSMLDSYDDPRYRKLQYRFQDLAGIVFGVNTHEADKTSIVKIIAAKCKAEGRSGFEFYQTRYVRQQQGFQIIPLSLL
jgi:hypothetical protein